jgi:hypothetical protein
MHPYITGVPANPLPPALDSTPLAKGDAGHYCPVVAVIPAKAGISSFDIVEEKLEIPAFAGMTDILKMNPKIPLSS